jgi:hypothetical protein
MFFRLITFLFCFWPLLLSAHNSGWRDFTSPRIAASSGAGVGAILFHDAIYLNPASLVFFNNSSIAYIKGQHKNSTNEGGSESFLLTDSSSELKGTLAYNYKNFNSIKTTHYAFSMGSNIGEKTAFALRINHFNDTLNFNNFSTETNQLNRLDFGFTHVFSDDLSFGFLFNDFTKAEKSSRLITAGFQYIISLRLQLLLDGGFHPDYDAQLNSFYKTALQINFLDSLYFRYGVMENNYLDNRGNSWGFSWVTPKLSFDYSFKKELSTISKDEQTEQMLMLSVRF